MSAGREEMLTEVAMTSEEVFRNYSAALDSGDRQALAALVHEDFQLEGAGLDGIGKAAFIAAMNAQMDAFPDYSENPSDIEERGDRVSFVAFKIGRASCRERV